MLAAEPDNVRNFVADIKAMLVNYHHLPSLTSLSLVEMPSQTKTDQWERTMILSALFRMGPSMVRYLPTSWSYKVFDRLANQYLSNDLFKNDLHALMDAGQVKDMLVSLCDLTGKAHRYQPNLSAEAAFKMHRLLWVLVFLGKNCKSCSTAVLPFAALYPLLDDLLDSPSYSKLNKTRLMERIHSRLSEVGRSTGKIPSPPPSAFTPPSSSEEAEIDKCVSELVLELQRQDAFTRNDIIMSLDVVRYAEEFDFMGEQEYADVDIYTRCAVKGASTLRCLLLISNTGMKPQEPARWNEMIMSFGFIMQMIDDLQDCESDYGAMIMTPFSDCLRRQVNLDSEIIKLTQFLRSPYCDNLCREGGGPLYGRLCLLTSMLMYLILEATVKHRSRLSVQLYKDTRHRLPVTKAWIKRHSMERETYRWFTGITKM